jgi:hypothetical protein
VTGHRRRIEGPEFDGTGRELNERMNLSAICLDSRDVNRAARVLSSVGDRDDQLLNLTLDKAEADQRLCELAVGIAVLVLNRLTETCPGGDPLWMFNTATRVVQLIEEEP